jgi:hypothetical protein
LAEQARNSALAAQKQEEQASLVPPKSSLTGRRQGRVP